MDPIYITLSEQHSHRFSVKNGVRQGAVSSAILFAVYINELLAFLRQARLGCHVQGVFYGALVFADDILLLSASRSGLQAMVDICYGFAAKRNLKFGTNSDQEKSKTKCKNRCLSVVRVPKVGGKFWHI